ncbi:MAG TPA: hypothetical protein OIL92_08160 [Oscillospiraceae bacterium]|nr:hypothetical protein [Oscillospiraceae bacterium]
MNYRNGRTQFAPTITSIKTIKSFAQAFSKACRSRATPLSFSAESEILLGFALKTHKGLRSLTLQATFTSKAGVEKA